MTPDKLAPRTLAIATLSAAAAACHEAVAPSLLTRWTGNSAWATGLALAVFMVGLGAGSLIPIAAPRVFSRPRRAYVAAEFLVALGALLALFALTGSAAPLVSLGTSRWLDVLAAGLVALPPALAMGATYPLLVESLRGAPRAAPSLYAAGLVGACAGALGCAGVLIPALGASRAVLVAAAGNVVVAAIASRGLSPAEATRSEGAPSSLFDAVTLDATLLFGATGALGLGAQAVWNRVLVPYAGVSSFAFAAVVAAYVAAQATGFALARRVSPERARGLSTMALSWSPALCLACLALCSVVSSWPGARDGAPLSWAAGTLAAVFAVVAPAAVALGAGQAAALASIDALPHRGRSAALATGLGTLFSALGSTVAALLLVPAVGPRWTLAALSLPLFAALARAGERSKVAMGVTATVALCVAAPGPRYFLGAEHDRERVLYARFGVQDTAAVVLHDQPVEPAIRRLVAAGVSYSGDSLFAQRYMRLLAHLPSLATAGRARAAVICVGTGTTLDALRLHGFGRVDAVDIDPTVRDTLAWFARAHHGAPDDPRVRLIIDDGDRHLASVEPRAYDVITLEPPPPRAPGGSTLYTEEFYLRARRALREGGVVAQWLPLHDMGAWEADALVATFLKVFPRASLHLAERNEAILLSSHARASEAPSPEASRDLASIGFEGLDALAETLFLDAAALGSLTRDAATVTRAWPAPELAPLSVPRPFEGLDAWAERAASRATPSSGDAFAAVLSPALAPFLRVRSGAAREGDRERVAAAMGELLHRRPTDPYFQYVHGYGDFLTARLATLARDGVDRATLDLAARRIEALRARARR